MGMQDSAFDVEHACRKECPQSAKEVIEYMWRLEEANERLSFAFNAYKTVIKIHQLCICGQPRNGNGTFCVKCRKLPRDVYGLPIRPKTKR